MSATVATPLSEIDTLRLLSGTENTHANSDHDAHDITLTVMNTLMPRNSDDEYKCDEGSKEKAKLLLKVKNWLDADKLSGVKVDPDKLVGASCGSKVKAQPDDVHYCFTDFIISLATWYREIDCPTAQGPVSEHKRQTTIAEIDDLDDIYNKIMSVKVAKDLLDQTIINNKRDLFRASTDQHTAYRMLETRKSALTQAGRALDKARKRGAAPIVSTAWKASSEASASRAAEETVHAAEDAARAAEEAVHAAVDAADGAVRAAVDGVRAAVDGVHAAENAARAAEEAARAAEEAAKQQLRNAKGLFPTAIRDYIVKNTTYILNVATEQDKKKRDDTIRKLLKQQIKIDVSGAGYTTLTSQTAFDFAKKLHRVSSDYGSLKEKFMVLKLNSNEYNGLSYNTEWGRATDEEIKNISSLDDATRQTYRINIVKEKGAPFIAECLKGLVDTEANVFYTDETGTLRIVCNCSPDMLYNLFMAVYNGQYSGAECKPNTLYMYGLDAKTPKNLVVLCNQTEYKQVDKTKIIHTHDSTQTIPANALSTDLKTNVVIFYKVEVNYGVRKTAYKSCKDLFNHTSYMQDVFVATQNMNKKVTQQFKAAAANCANLFADEPPQRYLDNASRQYYVMEPTTGRRNINDVTCLGTGIDDAKQCSQFIHCIFSGNSNNLTTCLQGLVNEGFDGSSVAYKDFRYVSKAIALAFFKTFDIGLVTVPNTREFQQPMDYAAWLNALTSTPVSQTKLMLATPTSPIYVFLANYIMTAINSCRQNLSILNDMPQSQPAAAKPTVRQTVAYSHPMYAQLSAFDVNSGFAPELTRWSDQAQAQAQVQGIGYSLLPSEQRGGAPSCANCVLSLYNEISGAIESLRQQGVELDEDDKKAIQDGYNQTLKFMEQAEKLKNVMVQALDTARQHGIKCDETKKVGRYIGNGNTLNTLRQKLLSTIKECKEHGTRINAMGQFCNAHTRKVLASKYPQFLGN